MIRIDDERLRRKEDGDLYEAWRSDPDALGLAQPSVGNKWIKVPDSFGDGIDMNPAVLMGLAGADGSYWAYERQGETAVSHRFAIKLKNSAANVRLLSAAKQLIGSGSVKVFAEKLLGYYVLVKFECSDEKCIKFLADYWRLAGPRAFQCQLAMFAQDVCKIGSNLKNLPQHVTDAQDMYMAALAAAKKEERKANREKARAYQETVAQMEARQKEKQATIKKELRMRAAALEAEAKKRREASEEARRAERRARGEVT